MLSCEVCRSLLPQYIADGEPTSRAPAGLREHLAACGDCRDLAARLRSVESALRAYPMAAVPPDLAYSVAAQIRPSHAEPAEEWRWLPWDVWVPALALVVAVVLVCFSAPIPAFSAGPRIAIYPVTVSVGRLLPQPGSALSADSSWAVWMLVSLGLAVVGAMVGIKAWRHADPSAHQAVQDRVDDVTRRLGSLIGRPQ